jgi:hypothetical protein
MRALAALLLALLALAGCGGGDEAATSTLEDLTELDQLRADFEASEGKTRVILLVAPT